MSDWTTDAADMIERSVALVRERTVEPAQAVSRVLVYGLLTVLIVIPTFILATVGALPGPRAALSGLRVGGLRHAGWNLHDRRCVLLDQAQTLTSTSGNERTTPHDHA